MKNLLILLILAAVFPAGLIWAQPNPADPDLRFWLAADSLAATHSDGDGVYTYTSLDSYATIMAPDLDGTSPEGLGIQDAAPIYELFSSGHSALRFDAAGPAGDPGARARMWQMNNLAALGQFDPVDIGAGTPLTIFCVYRNTATSGWLGGTNPIVAKRGTSSCVWEFGDQNADGVAHVINVIYDAITVYPSGAPTHGEDDWNLNAMTMDLTGDPDISNINFYLNNDFVNSAVMTPGANNGTLQTVGRNTSTPEAMGIGCHAQDCCGHSESFAGYIFEIIIYAKELAPGLQEFDDTVAYLSDKYWVGGGLTDPKFCGDVGTNYLPGDLDENCYVDIMDISFLSQSWLAGRNFDDFVGIAKWWLECSDPGNKAECPYWCLTSAEVAQVVGFD